MNLLRPSTLLAAGEAITLEVEVRVPVIKAFEAGTRVVLSDNGYWKQASVLLPEGLGAGEVVTVQLLAEPKRARMNLKDVKAEVELRVGGGGGGEEIIQRQLFCFDAIDFAGDLMPTLASSSSSSLPLRLFVLGGEQTGKSTFIETLRTVLASAGTTSIPPPDASSFQPTTTLTRVDLSSSSKNSRFRTPLQACAIELPSSMTTLGGEGAREDELKATLASAHAVLFFVAADEIETNPQKMEELQRFFLLLKSLSLTPLVILTHIDKIEPLIALDPFNWSLKKVAHLRRRVSQIFNISWAHTLVFVPYAAPKPAVMPVVAAKASMRTDVILRGESGGNFPDMRGGEGGGEGGAEGGEGGWGGRSFDIDRLVLFIGKAGLEAARDKVEGRSSSSSNASNGGGGEMMTTTPTTGGLTSTPSKAFMNGRLVGRQQTVELDGSFSSNFRSVPN